MKFYYVVYLDILRAQTIFIKYYNYILIQKSTTYNNDNNNNNSKSIWRIK